MAFDGGFRHGNASWGFIVSNANGDILFAVGHAYTGAQNAEESELGAIYHVLSYASHARFDNIWIVSDSPNVVNFMQGKDECMNWINYAFRMDWLNLLR